MKWKLIRKIEGVHSNFQANSNGLSYFRNDYTFCIRDLNDDYELKSETKFESDFSYRVIDDNYYFFGYGALYLLKSDNSALSELIKSDKQYIQAIDSNLFLASSYFRKTKLHESQLISQSKVIWEISSEYGFRKSFDKHLVFTNNSENKIAIIDLNSGKELWKYELDDGEKIIGDIFNSDNKLIFASMMGDMPHNINNLRSIDINSGSEVWKTEGYFLHLEQHKNSGKLYGFAGERYEVIDPSNGKPEIIKEFSGLKEKSRLQVHQGMSYLSEGGLYFVGDNLEGYYDAQFGMINIETHEIEFIQKLDLTDGAKVEPPIYHNGNLFIKDSMNTLHVYQKEMT